MSVPIFETTQLIKEYPLTHGALRHRRRRILNGLSISVASGERVALVGPNGAGKTTLARIACGVVLPDAGTARVCGTTTSHDPKWRSMVGLARPDDPALHPRLIVAECLRFHAALYAVRTDETQIKNALAHVEAERLFDRRVHTLSSGERAKVSLTKALLHAPRLLVLDELSRVLDPGAAQQVRRRLTEVVAYGTAVLLVTHDLNEAALADRVVVLAEGRAIASGTWSEVKQTTYKVFGL